MIDVIKKALEEAKKHYLKSYMIVCSKKDYLDVKTAIKSNPETERITVRWAEAVEEGKIYLWDCDFEIPHRLGEHIKEGAEK